MKKVWLRFGGVDDDVILENIRRQGTGSVSQLSWLKKL